MKQQITNKKEDSFTPFDNHPPFRQTLETLSSNPGDAVLRLAAEKSGVISLVQGQSDNITPDFIQNAAVKAMQEGKTFYGATQGQPVLLDALSRYYKNIYNADIAQERFFVTPSGTAAMHIALTSLLEPGDDIVAVTPIWKNLVSAVELTGARSVDVSLEIKDGKWQLDLEKLFDAVTPKTRALLIVTPSNPTGWTASETEIRAILNFARLNGLWVIADEVYGRMVYNGTNHAPSFLSIADENDNLIVINSFSKNWSMTGWRMGWLTVPERAAEKIRNAALYNHLCTPTFLQYGAAAALNEGETFLQDHLDLWNRNRETVIERLGNHPNIDVITPQATYYALFKVKGENDCLKLARRLIEEAGVALAPGCAFGKASAGYLRLCFAGGEDKLATVLDRIEGTF